MAERPLTYRKLRRILKTFGIQEDRSRGTPNPPITAAFPLAE